MSEDLKFRLGGLACVVGGLVMGWLAILSPLQEAARGVAEVSLSSKGAFIVGPLVLFGLFLLVTGQSGERRLRNAEKKSLTVLGFVVFGVCIAAGFAGIFGVQHLLEQQGYHYG